MRSVLLVDDEYFIRVRVRKCVDWQALGFDMVAMCIRDRGGIMQEYVITREDLRRWCSIPLEKL